VRQVLRLSKTGATRIACARFLRASARPGCRRDARICHAQPIAHRPTNHGSHPTAVTPRSKRQFGRRLSRSAEAPVRGGCLPAVSVAPPPWLQLWLQFAEIRCCPATSFYAQIRRKRTVADAFRRPSARLLTGRFLVRVQMGEPSPRRDRSASVCGRLLSAAGGRPSSRSTRSTA
jgi:hypothetical protein